VELFWEDSGEHFQAFEEELSCLKKVTYPLRWCLAWRKNWIACLIGLTDKSIILPTQLGAV